MKKRIEITQTICDFCLENETYHKCLCCGKDICYDCIKTKGVEYRYSTTFSGSEDGIYCRDCDILLANSSIKLCSTSHPKDYTLNLWKAYKNMSRLISVIKSDSKKWDSEEQEIYGAIKYFRKQLKEN